MESIKMETKILKGLSEIRRLISIGNLSNGSLHLAVIRLNGLLIEEYLLDRIPLALDIVRKIERVNLLIICKGLPYRVHTN